MSLVFEIRVQFPFDDEWFERDRALHELTGPSSWAGAGMGVRDVGYTRQTIEEASALKDRILDRWPDYGVAIREQ